MLVGTGYLGEGKSPLSIEFRLCFEASSFIPFISLVSVSLFVKGLRHDVLSIGIGEGGDS